MPIDTTGTTNLLALLIFIAIAFLGAIAHWVKKKRRNEVRGSLLDYLVADEPGSTIMMASGIIVAALAAGTTGALDGIEPVQVWALLKIWHFPDQAFHVVASAFGLGWMMDSGLNKGGKP